MKTALTLTLTAAWLWAAEPDRIRVQVIDPAGAAIPGARLELYDAYRVTWRQGRTGATGRFEFEGLPVGSYALRVEAANFQPQTVRVAAPSPDTIRVELRVLPVSSAITVSASRGGVEDAGDSPRLVTVREREEFQQRAPMGIGESLQSAPGVIVQQTTPGQVSPFLRGMTGYQTLLLIDGVRYNNATFRSGPNQYLSFVEPSQAQAVETVLGPAGAVFGSDALGGVVHVLTRRPDAPENGGRPHGELRLSAAAADLGWNPSGQVSLAGRRAEWLLGGAWHRHNDLRAGAGQDSHNVFRRHFGLSSHQMRTLLGGRLQDTGFAQAAAHTRLALRPSPDHNFSLWFQRGDLHGVRSYRDLLGGLGRLQARSEPQTLNFFYARYQKLRLGALDSLTGTFSVNSQRDDSVRQGTRFSDPVMRDENRVDAFGYALQATTHVSSRHVLVFGTEIYREHILSRRWEGATERRALFPNGSRYTTYGFFAQDTTELVRDKLRATLGSRATQVNLRTFAERNRNLGVTDAAQTFRDFSFHSSLVWQTTDHTALSLLVARGFRAPNLSDLGAVGLTGLGFEVPVDQAIPAGALLAADAGEGALPVGRPLQRLGPETLMNYELGLRVRAGKLYGRVQVFDAELSNPIVRRTVLFPAAAPPATVAGIPVTVLPPTLPQRAQAVVTVATPFDPRALKTFVNDGQARYYGLEARLEYAAADRWSLRGNYTYINGRDLHPNRPARRLPPQQGFLALRWFPGRRVWLQGGGTVTGPQTRLSAGDLDDERIGASRRRSDIATFFRSAVASPYITNGVFVPTGETLAQIQDRVLPLRAGVTDNTRVPLFSRTASWFSLDFAGGVDLTGRFSLGFGATNILDRNYRIHGSGIDAPGVNAFVSIRYLF